MKTNLKIDFASHEAAKYACQNWHYTKKIPVGKLVKVGAWENNKFIGVVIFGMGASAQVYKQFNIGQFEICELVRVALNDHQNHVSKILAISLKFLKKVCPKLKVIVSFADPSQGHHGGIYQATNWIFTGKSSPTREYFYNNDWRHVTDLYNNRGFTKEEINKLPVKIKEGKLRYVFPLDEKVRENTLLLSKPYPKRGTSKEIVAPDKQSGEGGENPTVSLQK